MEIFCIFVGIPLVALLLGVLCGNFLAGWLIIGISIVLVLCMVYLWKDIKAPNTMPGTSGKLGGDIIGFGMLICVALFLVGLWGTYLLTSDQSTVTKTLKSIEILRTN